MRPGETRRGWIGFDLPASTKRITLTWDDAATIIPPVHLTTYTIRSARRNVCAGREDSDCYGGFLCGLMGAPESPADKLDLAQYESLRTEILERTKTQNQLVSLSLIGIGTILTLGTRTHALSSFLLLLAYPYLAMFLAIGWASNSSSINDLAVFLRQLESRIYGNLGSRERGWETRRPIERFRKSHRTWPLYIHYVPETGIFIGSGLIAPVVALVVYASWRWWTILDLIPLVMIYFHIELYESPAHLAKRFRAWVEKKWEGGSSPSEDDER